MVCLNAPQIIIDDLHILAKEWSSITLSIWSSMKIRNHIACNTIVHAYSKTR